MSEQVKHGHKYLTTQGITFNVEMTFFTGMRSWLTESLFIRNMKVFLSASVENKEEERVATH